MAQRNIAAALPELSRNERVRLLAESVDALGCNLYDALTIERFAVRDFENVAGEPTLAAIRALRHEGRGVLILTGHLGCWELLGAYLASRLDGIAVVTGTIHNVPVDQLIQSRRRRLGMMALPREGDLRPLLRCLREGGVVAVLMDQNTRVPNVDVPFFGLPAPTAVGFAKLAVRYGVPVLPVAISRRGRGHEVAHLPPLSPPAGASPEQLCAFLTRCNAALEKLIRRNLNEWVWFHERWPRVGRDRGAMAGSDRRILEQRSP
jgi:KDO2-lipid IV(A) lauroyltransferase